MAGLQGGTLNTFWAVWYGMPCQSQAGVTSANVGQEAPHRFSGYSTVILATGDPPHPRPLKLVAYLPPLTGARRPSHPWRAEVAVLVPPMGDGVLNQIPAGDSRESSREQVVPGNGAPLHRCISSRGRETTSSC